MNIGRKFRLAPFLLGACFFVAPSAQSNQQFKTNDVMVSAQQIMDIFTNKRKTWIDGTSIKVLSFPENSVEHNMFVVHNLGIPPYVYNKIKDENAGNGTTNITVYSYDEMYYMLTSSTNCIGYMDDQIFYKDYYKLYKVKIDY